MDFPQHWSKLHTSSYRGPSPPTRFHHVACSVAPPTEHDYPLLLVGGGVGESGDVLKDMWVLDVDREVWSEVSDLVLFICNINYMLYHMPSISYCMYANIHMYMSLWMDVD